LSAITVGTILISSPALEEPHFAKSIILITEYNTNGAIGFIINKLFPRSLNELVEFNFSKVFPMFKGGPIGNESIYFIHRRPDLIEGGIHIVDNIFLGDDFQQAVANVNSGTMQKNEIKIFIGYCGWDAGDLETEIEEKSWLISTLSPEIILSQQNNDMLWDNLYNGQV